MENIESIVHVHVVICFLYSAAVTIDSHLRLLSFAERKKMPFIAQHRLADPSKVTIFRNDAIYFAPVTIPECSYGTKNMLFCLVTEILVTYSSLHLYKQFLKRK